jgi:hypothetical protein
MLRPFSDGEYICFALTSPAIIRPSSALMNSDAIIFLGLGPWVGSLLKKEKKSSVGSARCMDYIQHGKDGPDPLFKKDGPDP